MRFIMTRLFAFILGLFITQSAYSQDVPTFVNSSELLTENEAGGPICKAFVDVNGDYRDDIVRIANANKVLVDIQSNEGEFFQNFVIDTIEGDSWTIAVADVDNDGYSDILSAGNNNGAKIYNGGADPTQYNRMFESETDFFAQGSNFVDINNDGWMDIYVSKVSGHLHLKGANLLYINQGIDDSGNLSFKEDATTYGLDISALSTQTTFFDYDLDGDLDAYVLNHSLHPNSNYGKGSLRKKKDSIRGDKLLENKDGFFIDVTQSTGIYQSSIGYGLGISTGDLNNDGYPDLYLGNDFFENDYLYINQKDGTFIEINSTTSTLGHSSHFSMGNAQAI